MESNTRQTWKETKMRDIKFRVWAEITTKEWMQDQHNFKREYRMLKVHSIHCNTNNVIVSSDFGAHSLPLSEVNLMQYTGLKDLKRQEIYECDILKQYPGFGCTWKHRVGIVKYYGASFWIHFGAQSFVLDDHDCKFEVIGNIYENRELLK